MLEIFNTVEEYNIYTDNNTKLQSDRLYYVKEDGSMHFYTNNIDGEAKIYDGGDTESVSTELIGIIERSITEIDIPNGAAKIGKNVFAWCSSLIKVNIPASVLTIDESAFEGCISLSSVTIPYGVTSIGKHAFKDCSGLTSVSIPNSVTSIGYGAFYVCEGLTSISIPESVTRIEDYALYQCRLTELSIPNSVTYIGTNINSNNSNLTTLYIGSGVTEMKTRAFAYNSNLSKAYVYAIVPPTIKGNYSSDTKSVFDSASSNLIVYVPAESVDAYKAAAGWSVYADKIQAIPA